MAHLMSKIWTYLWSGHAAAVITVVGLSVSALQSFAANIYFLDATGGNDAWAGTAPAYTASPTANGPWQTLNRLNGVSLQPGDTVLLKCGETWQEPLVLAAMGNQVSPIRISSYSASTCISKPVISGTQLVPDHTWVHQSGNIFQTRLPANLIKSSGGIHSYQSWSASGNHSLALDASCSSVASNCVRLTSGSTNSIAISGNFPTTAGAQLSIEYRVKIQSGVTVKVVPRRGGPSYETVGKVQLITGTGDWQSYSYRSVFTKTISNARVDFELAPGGKTLSITDLNVSNPSGAPRQLFSTAGPFAPAHHPNRGFKTTNPNAIFASIAEDSDRVPQGSNIVSTYLTRGADFVLPPGADVMSGNFIFIRTNNWMMDELKVSRTAGNRIYFDRPSSYPLERHWGFYVTGSRWMLDSPGEWFFDPLTSLLYVWMPDSAAPGPRVSFTYRDVGLDVSGSSFVTIEGLDIRGFEKGIKMRSAIVVQILNSSVSNSGEFGIDAVGCQNCEIRGNTLANSMRDGLSATDPNGSAASGLRVLNNAISNSGIRGPSLTASDLPIRSFGAVRAGRQAVVTNNTIVNNGYIGILAGSGSTISGNHVENSCLVLNDCSAIYASGLNNASQISENTVSNVLGNVDGMPTHMTTLTNGVYLDELASGVRLSGNTLIGADNGLHIHDSFNNVISSNTFFGNRRYQIWAQETNNRQRAQGDLYGNQITGNRFFSAVPLNAVQHESIFTSTHSFATYQGNRYSTLLHPAVVDERWSNGGAVFDFGLWKATRAQDLAGTEVSSIGYSLFRVTGENQIPNGNITNGKTGWTAWNATAPFGQMTLESCPQGTCLRYFAGATQSLLTSPNFSVAQNQWYRVTFDARTADNAQPISVTVRRGGGGTNGYESLTAGSQTFAGSTSWQRLSFAFKATKTVNAVDPVTLDLGGRIDFDRIQPGKSMTIANVELRPLASIETTLKTRILLNAAGSTKVISCPDQSTDPILCTQFVKFSDGLGISWPHSLPPYNSEIIYSRDSSLTDTDGDGVPTFQDQCPSTPTGQMTNARGCSFAQSPQG